LHRYGIRPDVSRRRFTASRGRGTGPLGTVYLSDIPCHGVIMSESNTRHILIASFNTPDGAKRGVDTLKGAAIGLGNVAVITRDASGAVDFTESQDWGVGKSALVGAIAGLILPGVGTITLAAGGALAAYFLDLGFPDALLKEMGEGLTTNSSMLVALVDAASSVRAGELLAQGGGVIMGSVQESNLSDAIASMQRTS
jgi:uncharacterized membrane protein